MIHFNENVRSEEVEIIGKMNPESHMNISEIIQFWGYPAEEHEVLTDDGYYLSLNRIPGHTKSSKSSVLLVHCLDMEGSVWIANLPHQSLGFILADAGYDVWIANVRGNTWSRRHQHFSIDDEEYWNFSFHELGIYDLSAIINFILQKNGEEDIYYVCHSQGCTMGFVGFSIIPHLAAKIKMFFALAPSYTLQYTKSVILQLTRLPESLLKLIFGRKEFCLLSPTLRARLARMCSYQPFSMICKQGLFLVSGFHDRSLNTSRVDVYISRFPDYTSVKNIVHWSQTSHSGQFAYYDYGSKNKDIYNQTTPPLYDIEAITIPIAMWSGGQDWVSQPPEIAQLRHRITNLIHEKKFPEWNHWDFIWGLDAASCLYKEILALMATL
ncbi:lipase member M-like [Thamnophis elegans]|uniref:lipase member M-like n=1 Tax=Thamnophis elegans TaxID=35005 RepID=UPI0013775F46|nr:lipase member M-like [Thamnophis elegans]XP_032087792.1 lipase member M-like [Thamnophis elegans]